MDAQIHGALVGGALGGAVVLTGIGLTESLTRMRERKSRVEEAIHRLAIVIPHITTPISAMWAGDRPSTKLGSEWAARREETFDLLGVVRMNARWPMRRARKLHTEAIDLSARLGAAEYNWLESRQILSSQDWFDVSAGELHRLVVKSGLPVADELFRKYQEDFHTRSPIRGVSPDDK